MSPGQPSSQGALNPSKAGAQWVKQSPEPFRNSSFGAAPNVHTRKDSGADGDGRYTNYHGNPISVGMPTSKPKSNPGAVGIKGAGMGSNNGKVVGMGMKNPPRAGSFVNVPQKKKSPSFYGR